MKKRGVKAMKILVAEPGHRPKPQEIDSTVEAMRAIMGDKIQARRRRISGMEEGGPCGY